MEDLDEKVKAFEERIAEKKKTEEAEETQKVDKLRQDYLERTGRTEMKP